MSARLPLGLTLDAGALIALQRRDVRTRALLSEAERHHLPIDVPAGVVAQVGRCGPRQALISRLLASSDVSVAPLDEVTALAVGVLVGKCGHPDVVDVSVVLHALGRDHLVVTSDPGDLRRVSAEVRLFVV